MIELVSGVLRDKGATSCLVDCHGVGLGISISLNTFQDIDHLQHGDTVSLFTYLHVREDAMQLFGFSTVDEKEMFQLLIAVSGVGPKLAIAILSGGPSGDLKASIGREDVAMLTRIPGVGKKTAQRLILELKEKIKTADGFEYTDVASTGNAALHGKVNEALLAMISLGYKQQDAKRAIDKVLSNTPGDPSLEEIIKLALKEM